MVKDLEDRPDSLVCQEEKETQDVLDREESQEEEENLVALEVQELLDREETREMEERTVLPVPLETEEVMELPEKKETPACLADLDSLDQEENQDPPDVQDFLEQRETVVKTDKMLLDCQVLKVRQECPAEMVLRLACTDPLFYVDCFGLF